MLLIDRVHSLQSPPQMRRFHFGYNGHGAEKGEAELRSVTSDSGTRKMLDWEALNRSTVELQVIFFLSRRILLWVYLRRFSLRQNLCTHTRSSIILPLKLKQNGLLMSAPSFSILRDRVTSGEIWKTSSAICVQWEVQQITHLAARSSAHLLIK